MRAFREPDHVTLRSQRIRCVGYPQSHHSFTHESGCLPVLTPAETHLPGLLTIQSNRVCCWSAHLYSDLGERYTVS